MSVRQQRYPLHFPNLNAQNSGTQDTPICRLTVVGMKSSQLTAPKKIRKPVRSIAFFVWSEHSSQLLLRFMKDRSAIFCTSLDNYTYPDIGNVEHISYI